MGMEKTRRVIWWPLFHLIANPSCELRNDQKKEQSNMMFWKRSMDLNAGVPLVESMDHMTTPAGVKNIVRSITAKRKFADAPKEWSCDPLIPPMELRHFN